MDASAGESVEATQLALVCQLDGLSAVVGAPDLDVVVRVVRPRWGGEGGLTPMYRHFMLMMAGVWVCESADGVLERKCVCWQAELCTESGCLGGVEATAGMTLALSIGFHVHAADVTSATRGRGEGRNSHTLAPVIYARISVRSRPQCAQEHGINNEKRQGNVVRFAFHGECTGTMAGAARGDAQGHRRTEPTA